MNNGFLNSTHMHDKKHMTPEMLVALVDADYMDVSWGNNECASFLSPCERFELFVVVHTHLPLAVTFYVADITDDEDTPHSSNTYTPTNYSGRSLVNMEAFTNIHAAINWIGKER